MELLGRELPATLQSEAVQTRVAEVNQSARHRVQDHQAPFEEELEEAGLALVAARSGDNMRPVIVPRFEGEPVRPERFQALQQQGRVDQTWLEEEQERIQTFLPKLRELTARAAEIRQQTQERVQEVVREAVRTQVETATAPIRAAHPEDCVAAFLDALTDDVVSRSGREPDARLARTYQVNVLSTHDPGDPAPLVVDNAPSAAGLLGTVEVTLLPDGTPVADHLSIRAGSLLQADGGFLVLEAADVVQEPGAWRALVRTLRAGRVEWGAPERQGMGPLIKPDPVPVDVKVVLLGSPETYALLDRRSREFGHQFKVLADFDSTLDRGEDSVRLYASVVARLGADEGLLPFAPSAVGALAEHGARIADRGDKLTARFGRLGDLAREASFIAREAGADVVTGAHLRETVRRTKQRADLPGRRFREAVARGILRIDVTGRVAGQINGLAVVHAGPLTYGFPMRISATAGPGTGGTVNIEGEARLSGQIHTKGFQILLGLLRTLLPADHPLAFDASIAFEQSYGGIDGDSASGAEACCLLSALTRLPLRQDLAMTGAIDQLGHILPVGAVNEKVEGFFDVCAAVGLTGTQGVLVPAANQDALMLREDVVQACADGRFHVYAVGTIHEALGLLLDQPAGRLQDGAYPADTVLGRAMARLAALWEMAEPHR